MSKVNLWNRFGSGSDWQPLSYCEISRYSSSHSKFSIAAGHHPGMERSLQTFTVLHPLQWPALRVGYTEQPSLSPVTPGCTLQQTHLVPVLQIQPLWPVPPL